MKTSSTTSVDMAAQGMWLVYRVGGCFLSWYGILIGICLVAGNICSQFSLQPPGNALNHSQRRDCGEAKKLTELQNTREKMLACFHCWTTSAKTFFFSLSFSPCSVFELWVCSLSGHITPCLIILSRTYFKFHLWSGIDTFCKLCLREWEGKFRSGLHFSFLAV